jgi:hypothetical protein
MLVAGVLSASQAENTSPILVARTRLDFVATTGKIATNIAVGFGLTSPLFSHGARGTYGTAPALGVDGLVRQYYPADTDTADGAASWRTEFG